MVPATSRPRISESPGGGGVLPFALHQVGAVDGGGDDLNQDFALFRFRGVNLADLEDVQAAEAVEQNSFHHDLS